MTSKIKLLALACLLALGLGAAVGAARAADPILSYSLYDGANPNFQGQSAAYSGDEYRFLCSAIGDSLTDSSPLQSIFYSRLNDPGYSAFRSIPGGTQVNFHGNPGGTTGSILPATQSHDWGAGEGANFVVIMVGTNDLDYNQGDAIEDLAAAMVSNVQAIVDSALGGVSDPNLRPAIIVSGVPAYLDATLTSRAKYYNEQLRTKLDRVDIFTDGAWWDLYDSGTGTAYGWLMDDYKHPNGDGFYRIAEDWFKGVDALYNSDRIGSDSHIYRMPWYFERS